MSRSLAQIITIEKGVHSRNYEALSEIHKKAQKPDQFAGISKTYDRATESEEEIPAEVKLVQLRHEMVLTDYRKLWTEWWDLESTKDDANTRARADVVVDGTTIVAQAPVTFLLFLEKQLTDIRKAVDVLPELPSDKEWTLDTVTGVHRSEPRKKARTQTRKTAVTLVPAQFKEGFNPLPAQAQLIDDQVITGYYTEAQFSGAIPPAKKRAILERVNKLIDATKDARQRANRLDVEDKPVAAAVFTYLFGAS
jgi:hypothetical protein